MNKIICPSCKDPDAVIVLMGIQSGHCMGCDHQFNAQREYENQHREQKELEKRLDRLNYVGSISQVSMNEHVNGISFPYPEPKSKSLKSHESYVSAIITSECASGYLSDTKIQNLIPGEVLRTDHGTVWGVVTNDPKYIATSGTIMSLEGMITLK